MNLVILLKSDIFLISKNQRILLNKCMYKCVYKYTIKLL